MYFVSGRCGQWTFCSFSQTGIKYLRIFLVTILNEFESVCVAMDCFKLFVGVVNSFLKLVRVNISKCDAIHFNAEKKRSDFTCLRGAHTTRRVYFLSLRLINLTRHPSNIMNGTINLCPASDWPISFNNYFRRIHATYGSWRPKYSKFGHNVAIIILRIFCVVYWTFFQNLDRCRRFIESSSQEDITPRMGSWRPKYSKLDTMLL